MFSSFYGGVFPILSSDVDDHKLYTIQKKLVLLLTFLVGKYYKIRTLATVKLYISINPNYPVGKYIKVLVIYV